MREIFIQLFEKYAAYRGHGKLAALFIAALICLIFMRKNHRGRVHPLLFVMSVFTGIATALTGLLEKAFEKKRLYGILSVLFVLFAVTLSGGRIWSTDFTDKKETIRADLSDAENAAAYLCGLEENPKVLADYEMMTNLQCYSSHLLPLYQFGGSTKAGELSEDDKKLHDAISDQHPPMELITRLTNKEGHFYVAIDKTRTWPERAAEGNYNLINTIGNIDIYEYGGYAHE